jgi:cytidine deaminase
MPQEIENEEWKLLSEKAWEVRERAHLYGDIKVGASLLAENGQIYSGCNIEHNIRSHDIHAEVNAICNLISSGGKKIKKIFVVAEMDLFTPCGSCMDWILQFSTEETLVGVQNKRGGEFRIFKPVELMPFYPR